MAAPSEICDYRDVAAAEDENHTPTEPPGFDRPQWRNLVLGVVVIKATFYLLDPVPQFFFGDTETYVGSAIEGWGPPNRSYLYGRIIRWTALALHGLSALILTQVLMSAASSILLAFVLRRWFGVRTALALASGWICALEPIQLMYERYVLTEAPSLLTFGIWLSLSLWVLESPRLVRIVLWQLSSFAVMGLKTSFLPLLGLSVLLIPLLSWLEDPERGRAGTRRLALATFASVAAALVVHTAYKQWNGRVAGRYAAYNHEQGAFLVAAWLPVVAPEDCGQNADRIFSALKFDPRNRRFRPAQRWAKGGFVDQLRTVIPDPHEADRQAAAIAWRAFRRDPLGIARLALHEYLDYFDRDYMASLFRTDRGDVVASEKFSKWIREYAPAPAESFSQPLTTTHRLVQAATPWWYLILVLPFLTIPVLISRDRRRRAAVLWVWTAAIVLLLSYVTFGGRPSVRYLHTSGWVTLLLIGVLLERGVTAWSKRQAKAS